MYYPAADHQGFISQAHCRYLYNAGTGLPGRQEDSMTQFRQKPGTKSAGRNLKRPIPNAETLGEVVRSLRLKNPLGCTPYMKGQKNHPPIEIVREMYTAKFVYTDTDGKQVGTGSEVYNSLEGYGTGIAAVISNMANIASHRGKVRHLPAADRFSVLLKCCDPNGEMYFISISRNHITVASYTDNTIKKKVEAWADTVPELS
jgi:hypothetical protein